MGEGWGTAPGYRVITAAYYCERRPSFQISEGHYCTHLVRSATRIESFGLPYLGLYLRPRLEDIQTESHEGIAVKESEELQR